MASQISHSQIEPFGVEAKVDLQHELTEHDKQEPRQLYAREGLLLIRGLKLSMEEQLSFCSNFGPVLRGKHDKYPVSNVAKDGLLGDLELLFHHDIPYVPAPFLAGSLHGLEVSEGASGTKFDNGYSESDALIEQLLSYVYAEDNIYEHKWKNGDIVIWDNLALQHARGKICPKALRQSHT